MKHDPRDFDLELGQQFTDAQLIAASVAVSFYKRLNWSADKAAANIQALMDGEVRSMRWSRDRYLYSRALYREAFRYVYDVDVSFNREPDLTLRSVS